MLGNNDVSGDSGNHSFLNDLSDDDNATENVILSENDNVSENGYPCQDGCSMVWPSGIEWLAFLAMLHGVVNADRMASGQSLPISPDLSLSSNQALLALVGLSAGYMVLTRYHYPSHFIPNCDSRDDSWCAVFDPFFRNVQEKEFTQRWLGSLLTLSAWSIPLVYLPSDAGVKLASFVLLSLVQVVFQVYLVPQCRGLPRYTCMSSLLEKNENGSVSQRFFASCLTGRNQAQSFYVLAIMLHLAYGLLEAKTTTHHHKESVAHWLGKQWDRMDDYGNQNPYFFVSAGLAVALMTVIGLYIREKTLNRSLTAQLTESDRSSFGSGQAMS